MFDATNSEELAAFKKRLLAFFEDEGFQTIKIKIEPGNINNHRFPKLWVEEAQTETADSRQTGIAGQNIVLEVNATFDAHFDDKTKSAKA